MTQFDSLVIVISVTKYLLDLSVKMSRYYNLFFVRVVTVRLRLVKGCLDSLASASMHYMMIIVWVPGHSSIAGNFKVDELASSGTLVSLVAEWVGPQLAFCGLLLYRWASDQLSKRWSRSSTSNCALARSF